MDRWSNLGTKTHYCLQPIKLLTKNLLSSYTLDGGLWPEGHFCSWEIIFFLEALQRYAAIRIARVYGRH